MSNIELNHYAQSDVVGLAKPDAVLHYLEAIDWHAMLFTGAMHEPAESLTAPFVIPPGTSFEVADRMLAIRLSAAIDSYRAMI